MKAQILASATLGSKELNLTIPPTVQSSFGLVPGTRFNIIEVPGYAFGLKAAGDGPSLQASNKIEISHGWFKDLPWVLNNDDPFAKQQSATVELELVGFATLAIPSIPKSLLNDPPKPAEPPASFTIKNDCNYVIRPGQEIKFTWDGHKHVVEWPPYVKIKNVIHLKNDDAVKSHLLAVLEKMERDRPYTADQLTAISHSFGQTRTWAKMWIDYQLHAHEFPFEGALRRDENGARITYIRLK